MNSPGDISHNMAEALLAPPLERGQAEDVALYSGDEAVTFGQLFQRVNQAGNAFKSLGLAPGDRALLLVRDTPQFFYVFLGLMRIGAVPVPLNLRLSPTDLAYAIEDSGCRILFLDRQFIDIFRAGEKDLRERPVLVFTDEIEDSGLFLADLMAGQRDDLAAEPRAADDMAFWLYTSGTTGQPKAVVHQQKTIMGAKSFLGELHAIGPGDRIFCSSKLFFAFSLAHCCFASLTLGASAILYADWPDPDAITAVAEKYRPTVMLSVPTFYRNLLRDGAAEKQVFKDVRAYISAGEKLPLALFDRWQAATGRPLYDGIGASETCFLFVANGKDDYRGGTCGKPTPGTEVKLIDLDGETVIEPNVPGVLWVRMPSVAGRYWRQEDRSRAAFQDGWYCTNDMFTRDEEGWFEHQGRGDDMLKISGQWVSPAEIEEQVLKNSKVADAAVVGIANEDGLIRLALFVVAPEAEAAKDGFEKELMAQLTGSLAIYKCPRRIFYLDAMPVTGSGKLQRFALREIALARVRELS